MRTLNRLAISAALAGTAVVVAGPAGADELSGTYRYVNDAGKPTMTWTILPCGPECVVVAAAPGPAEVHPSRTFGATAQLDGQQWTMAVTTSQEDTCYDWDFSDDDHWGGTQSVPYSETMTFTWDSATLAGNLTEKTDYFAEDLYHPNACDWDDADVSSGPYPFTLTRA